MKAIKLRDYQVKAIESIQKAFDNFQKDIVVEMISGSGRNIVLAKTIQMLNRKSTGKILIVTNRIQNKEQIENTIFDEYRDFAEIDESKVIVNTEQKILRKSNGEFNEFQVVVFYDMVIRESIYKKLDCNKKTIIVFSENHNRKDTNRLFKPENLVFSYGYEDAINDGVITPAMDARALEPAIVSFSKNLLEQFGYAPFVDKTFNNEKNDWDLIVYRSNQKIWVECKAYKSEVVSPTVANSMLNNVLMRKLKHGIKGDDIVLLMVLSRVPSFKKDEIFKRYRIIVWDIENLVFYSKNYPSLLKQLSQITYFPIDYIEGNHSAEAELAQLYQTIDDYKLISEAENEISLTDKLVDRLKTCKTGEKHSAEYEAVCEDILRTLFESDYFNKLRNQYKTKDTHFRMDLIGALKVNQSHEKSMHPLWQMLVQHYNSHFIVFEFKNYAKEIDQNLIYITEKYLYDVALRNVAIIVSRKGFSKSAKFAAEGCLKENGKLILDISDSDLIDMLKSDNAADILLGKMEDFLMGISK